MNTEATVRKLREDTEPKPAPAIGMSLQFDLGGNRTLVLQTHVDGDAPALVINSALDLIAQAADRQRLRYDLKVMRKELKLHQKTLKAGEEDFARIEAKAKAAYDAQLKALAMAIVEGDARGENAWKARGKQGAYKREGAWAQQAANKISELENLRAQGFKLSDKEAIERDNAQVTLGKHRERIAEIEQEIKEAEAALAGSG